MPTSRDLHKEVAFAANLKQLTAAYEEIAVMRIDRIRRAVLAARLFREGLSGVVTEVRFAHQEQIAALVLKNQQRLNSRQAAVLLSTNTRLSGRITPLVSDYFAGHVPPDADILILGQVGKEHFAQHQPGRPVVFFPLPSHQPTLEDIQPLLEQLLSYQAITFYFGRFQNIVEQQPAAVQLGDVLRTAAAPSPAPAAPARRVIPYIFEPSLEVVIDFFNKQIFAMLVKQTLDESWLSLLGSRITAMEQASHNIERKLEKLSFAEHRQQSSLRNRKQRDRLAGLKLWQIT